MLLVLRLIVLGLCLPELALLLALRPPEPALLLGQQSPEPALRLPALALQSARPAL